MNKFVPVELDFTTEQEQTLLKDTILNNNLTLKDLLHQYKINKTALFKHILIGAHINYVLKKIFTKKRVTKKPSKTTTKR